MSARSVADPNGWELNPHYQIEFDLVPARVRAVFNERTVADSMAARVMYELGHAPMYYLPRDDVDMTCLEASELDTYCPYKGHASYWSVRVAERVAANSLWTYARPHAELAHIEGFVGFYWGRMDRWYEDDQPVSGPREIPGRIDTTMQLKKLFPSLAAQWHPTRNPGIKPYEFPAYSGAVVWWQDEQGRQWRQSIRERVLQVTTCRADGDADPYD